MDKSSSHGLSKCIVRDCSTIQGDRPVFRLPKDVNKFEKWLQNVNRLDLLEKGSQFCYDNRRICNLHFEDKMFTDSFKNKLKRNAMPIVLPLKVEERSGECSNTRNVGNSSTIAKSDLSLSTDDTCCQTPSSLSSNTPRKRKLPGAKRNAIPIVLQPSKAAESSKISEELAETSSGKCSNNIGNSSTMKINDLSLSTDDTCCQTPSSLSSNSPKKIKLPDVCFKSKLNRNAVLMVLQPPKAAESSNISKELAETRSGKCSNNVDNSSTMKISDLSLTDDPCCQTTSSMSSNTSRKLKLPDVAFKSKLRSNALPIVLQPSKAAESSKITEELVETRSGKCSNNVDNSSTMKISDLSLSTDDTCCQTNSSLSANTSRKIKLPDVCFKTKLKTNAMPIVLQPLILQPIVLQPSKAAESNKISNELVVTGSGKCSNNVGNSSTMEISDSSLSRDDPNCQTPSSLPTNTSRKRKLPQKLNKTSKQQTSLVNKPEQCDSKTISTQQFLDYCTQHFSPVFVEIIKAQHGLFGISANGMRYSTEFKQFALELYFLSPLAYEFLSQSINLPSKSTLMEMTKKWKIDVGLSDKT